MRRGGQPVGGGEQGGAPRPDPYPARNEGRLAKTRLRALEVQPLSRASDGDAHQRACDRRLPSFLLETTVVPRALLCAFRAVHAGRWTSAPPQNGLCPPVTPARRARDDRRGIIGGWSFAELTYDITIPYSEAQFVASICTN